LIIVKSRQLTGWLILRIAPNVVLKIPFFGLFLKENPHLIKMEIYLSEGGHLPSFTSQSLHFPETTHKAALHFVQLNKNEAPTRLAQIW